MKSARAAALLLAACFAWENAAAQQSASAQRMVSDVCSKCHGPKGQSQSSLFPSLAGQQAAYIESQLKAFRSHGRADPHAQAYMWGVAGPLSDAQISALAKYLAAQTPAPGTPPDDPQLAAEGKDIYKAGIAEEDVPPCRECHGAEAQGQGAVPRLAGQHRDYLFRQIQDFRTGLRASSVMHKNAKNITDRQASALASYLSSL